MKKKYLSPSCDTFYFELEGSIMDIISHPEVNLPVNKGESNDKDQPSSWE